MIRAYYWPAPAAPVDGKPDLRHVTLLMFHGNAGNREDRLGFFRWLRNGLGCGVCLVDYRG